MLKSLNVLFSADDLGTYPFWCFFSPFNSIQHPLFQKLSLLSDANIFLFITPIEALWITQMTFFCLLSLHACYLHPCLSSIISSFLIKHPPSISPAPVPITAHITSSLGYCKSLQTCSFAFSSTQSSTWQKLYSVFPCEVKFSSH